ncbi:hypothetical protein [Phytohalomonas tamaricis]|uniref:hypothetical protein n=1 Tax=Phytohalomonas tamaricis TaxID=2081032 RepID=UPI0021D4342B|nr:hypothetical protein [Phytohalomonas tamaricis]
MSQSLGTSDKLARGIGWFSVGMGLFELFAPRTLTHALGMEGKETLVRACGMRQIISGIGALSDNPTPAIWSRVGGDALDIAALTPGLRDENPQKHNVELAMTFVAVTCAADLYCAQALHKRHKYPSSMVYDYSDRSGFYRLVADMHGAASDFEVPANMRAYPPMWAEFTPEKESGLL